MKRLLAILPALAIACAACKGSDNAPTTAATTTKTETFTGTVQVKSADVHTFTVSASGTIQVTLTAASPPSTIAMGVGIGTPGDSNSCGIVTGGSVTTSAGSIAQLTGVASPGTLCVSVFDVGNQTAAVSYTVTVSHP